jgi:hypothetical protein
MQQVLLGLSQGVPLTVVCRSNNVHRSTIHEWRTEDETFAQAYDDARALGFDHIAVEALEIADDKRDDLIVDADGTPHPNRAAVLRAKVRVDTRLRLLAKWCSGRYGKQRSVEADANIVVADNRQHVIDPNLLSAEQRDALRGLLRVAQGLIGPVSADE